MIEFVETHKVLVIIFCATLTMVLTFVREMWKERREAKWENDWCHATPEIQQDMLDALPNETGFAGFIERLFFRREVKHVRQWARRQQDCERLGVSMEHLDWALACEQACLRGVHVHPGDSVTQINKRIVDLDEWEGATLRARHHGTPLAGLVGYT